jgi:peptide chain release factor 1
MTHGPTGIVVSCQNERSQNKNKERAFSVLRSRVFALKERERLEKISKERSKSGSGDFSERVRTYNQPQGRVTDHRVPGQKFSLSRVLAGDLMPVLEALNG